MDIQYESTPPKRPKCIPSSPSSPSNPYPCTPPKNSLHLPQPHTPVRNPESKRPKPTHANSHTHTARKTPKTPNSSHKVTEFMMSRLEQDYIFERKLGEGNFSSVGLYRSRMTGDYFAIKNTKLSSMSVNQAQALATLSVFNQKSKNIIRYYHSWVEQMELFLVMEYCNETLSNIYRSHRNNHISIQQSELKHIFKQCLLGLKCMHENQMVHLDIKPDNLLFKEQILKISDLGLARITKLKREGDLQEGDARYIAKQLLNYRQGIDLTKSDIFSLGISLYEGMQMKELQNNGDEWMDIRENGLRLKNRMDMQNYSEELLQILEKMTRPLGQERPSASEILKMGYFRESIGVGVGGKVRGMRGFHANFNNNNNSSKGDRERSL